MSLNLRNLDLLLRRLETITDDKFDMRNYYTQDNEYIPVSPHRGTIEHSCGTAACLAGWIYEIDPGLHPTQTGATEWLGAAWYQDSELFTPAGYREPGRYTRQQAIRMLQHMRSEFLCTGRVIVDWDAPCCSTVSEPGRVLVTISELTETLEAVLQQNDGQVLTRPLRDLIVHDLLAALESHS